MVGKLKFHRRATHSSLVPPRGGLTASPPGFVPRLPERHRLREVWNKVSYPVVDQFRIPLDKLPCCHLGLHLLVFDHPIGTRQLVYIERIPSEKRRGPRVVSTETATDHVEIAVLRIDSLRIVQKPDIKLPTHCGRAPPGDGNYVA